MKPEDLKKLRNGYTTHALQRARERFGLNLSGKDLGAIALFILSGRAVPVETPEESAFEGRSTWQVNVAGVDVVAVFDTRANSVVSFLTTEMATENLRRTEKRRALLAFRPKQVAR